MFWPKIISNQHLLAYCEGVAMDWTCDEMRARQHLPHSPSLDTGEKMKTGMTQERLVANCRRGAHDPPPYLGDCSEAGPK